LASIFSIFVSIGVGRLALGMVLPAMGDALNLNYVQMGWISTANFIGYLLGALYVRRLLPRHGERRLVAMSLILVVGSMAGVAMASGFITILILYSLTGLGSGIAFVCTLSLLPHWFATTWRGRAVGFGAGGMGLAIMLAGWAVPLANSEMGEAGWRLCWGGLAAICLPLAIFCLVVMRNRPLELGLAPYGEAAANDGEPAKSVGSSRPDFNLRKVIPRLGAVYFLFGATYVVYGTFIVTTLMREHGMAEAEAGRFWILLGIFSLFGGTVLGAFSDRMGRRAGIALSLFLQGSAYALISYGSGAVAVYLSICLYGLSAFGVPVIMSATVADYASPQRAAAVFGTITAIFGVGQMLGPVLAGVMAEYSGRFTSGYLASVSLVAVAIAITLTLPDPPS
ncbi:MAG: YbfB/YjiJ family MFS transporter, partial [Rhodospirillaceae bacterium]|nr:YbfB/YjiJ family MFS transporter [Rhodospirillaceae bacterium]